MPACVIAIGPKYPEAIALRPGCARFRVLIVEGVR